jgi:phage terminase large subunit-like protein
MAKLCTDLQNEGVVVTEQLIPMGQGFASMNAPTKELLTLLMQKKIRHGGNPVLEWMASNVAVKQDPAGNLKPDKSKSTERIDGIVAMIMALDRAIRHENEDLPEIFVWQDKK